VAIVPDTKDWTWVLERPCPECGFDGRQVTLADVPAIVDSIAPIWARVLERADTAVRPSPDRWSALEYACHVRDVYRLYDARLALMLTEDEPSFANWDQDATAVEDRYGEQDPAVVVAELADAAASVAAAFRAVRPDQHGRGGTRSDGVHFTVESFGRYFIHDPLHHLWDVGEPTSLGS
jgi:hypothetical protein